LKLSSVGFWRRSRSFAEAIELSSFAALRQACVPACLVRRDALPTSVVRFLPVRATVRAAVLDPGRARVALASVDQEEARPAEVPDRAALVEDRQEEMEHQEFEEVWTSCLIGTAFHSGCMDYPDSHRACAPVTDLVH
jgi:hypothetical protein